MLKPAEIFPFHVQLYKTRARLQETTNQLICLKVCLKAYFEMPHLIQFIVI